MNTGLQGILPMYDIFGCASDFAHNFRLMMPTTLNCGATVAILSWNNRFFFSKRPLVVAKGFIDLYRFFAGMGLFLFTWRFFVIFIEELTRQTISKCGFCSACSVPLAQHGFHSEGRRGVQLGSV